MQKTASVDPVQLAPVEVPDKPIDKPFSRYLSINNAILLGIIVVGTVLRWANLLVLPIFADETLHIQGGLAAQSGKLNSDGVFNLVYTSRILQSWFLAVIYYISGNTNLLLLGRAFSGLCGIVTILTCYKIGETLFSSRAGLAAAAMWAIVPFAVWHERMDLADPFQTSATGLVIYFSLALLRLPLGRKCNIYALLLGLSMVTAFLGKFNSFLILPVPILAALFLYPPAKWNSFVLRLFMAYYLAGCLVLPVLLLNVGNFGSYQLQNQVISPTLDLVTSNFRAISDWFYAYLTLPLIILVVASMGWAFMRGNKSGRFLFAAAVLPFLIQGGFLLTLFPRYFLFNLVPFLILAGGFLDYVLGKLKDVKFSKAWLPAAILILTLPILCLDLNIVVTPAEAALPQIDQFQYIKGPWSGTGVAEVTSFLVSEQTRTAKQLVVFTSPFIPSFSLKIDFYRNPDIDLEQIHVNSDGFYVKLDKAFEGNPAYFVAMVPEEENTVKEYQDKYPNLKFVPVLTVPKPGNLVSWQVYRLDYTN